MSEVIRAAAKKWFYESFDCDLLEKMEKAGLIAQAEGFSISVMAELELEIGEAFDRVTAERDAALAREAVLQKGFAQKVVFSVRDICELEPADSDDPECICIKASDLGAILSRHFEGIE